MTIKQIFYKHYEGLAEDDKPTGVLIGSTFKVTDTGAIYKTYDGTNWVLVDKRVRLVEEDGTFIDLPTELAAIVSAAEAIVPAAEAIETALAALGYEFTINGVNFNGYAKIKNLLIPTGAKSGTPKTLQFEGADYKPDTNKIFVATKALIYMFDNATSTIARIGEGTDTPDEAISKQVLSLSHGTNLPFMEDCIGVFTEGKYIIADTTGNPSIQTGSMLFGVELDIS